MTLPFLRTLTGKTLIRLAVGGAAVLVLATAIGTWLLYRQLQEQAAQRLIAQAAERARVAERVLSHNVETLEALRAAFVERWPKVQDAATAKRFETILARYPDGEWRSRKEFSDGRVFATGWVSQRSPLSDDLRRRMVLFFDLLQHYGPGAAVRRDNLFFVGIPEQSNMGYDPYLYPDWIFDIGDKFNQLDYEWGRLAYRPAQPGDRPRWTTPYVDEVAPQNGPTFTVVLPVHVDGRHLATAASSVLLRDFLARAFPETQTDNRYLLFHPDGQLITDTRAADRLSPAVTQAMLEQLGGELSDALRAASTAAQKEPQSGYSEGSDTYFGVVRIEGPGWFVASTLPGAVVRSRAQDVAVWALAAGFGGLVLLLLVFAAVLRRQVAAPLGDLTRAAERLAAGDTAVRLPSGRDDELGRLAVAFNDMTVRVAERDAALRQDKQEIEAALTSLRLTEERWRAMTDNASDFIAVMDDTGTLTYVSPPAERMLGHPVADLTGRTLFERVHPDDVLPLRDALLLADATQARSGIEFRARHRDGSWRVLEVLGSDLRQHPAVRGMVLNIRDISETVKAEHQLRQAQKLEAIGTLAGGIAHDFNNILAAILGYGEMAQKDAAPGTALRRHVDAALSAGMRAKSLVERILAFSRSGMGERVAVHVQSTVAEALDGIAASLPPGVVLERELHAGDAAVLGDPTQVHQVVMNLCANAVQAMKSSGTLFVALHRVDLPETPVTTTVLPAGSYVCVRVRDTGTGIAPQVLERIFDPFFTTKEVGVGTGLGLSLVHGIVTDLGGGIDVASRTGEGSTFTVYLPSHGTVQAQARVDEPAPLGHGETILLVDDEETLVRLGEEMIAELGYEPVGFASSTAALASFRATPQRFHAVLSDESMPDMTGSELAQAIRSIRPDIPIVLMTGFVTPGLSSRARDAGIRDVLTKPLVSGDIARSLSEALRGAGAA